MRVVVIGSWAPSLIKFRGPLLAAMVRRGHEVTAMAPEARPGDGAAAGSDIPGQLAAIGVRFEPIEIERAGLNPAADIAALYGLVRRLRAVRPDLVLGYTIKPVIYGIAAAWLAGVPRRAAMITGMGSALVSPRTPQQRLVFSLVRGMYRQALAQCQVVLFQNTDNRDELARLGMLPPHVKVAIVRGSGVDLAHYAPSPVPPGPPVFLFLGRLLRDKGIQEYVAAARTVRARVPSARFQIAGWLDAKPEALTRHELDAIIAEGIVEYLGATDDVRPLLAAAHALVLPSYHEGTPRSVLEAMSMNRAVITTDVPGCRDTVVDGESGLLVPARDAGELAKAMLLLATTPALIAQLAAAGHARAVALYDADKVAASVLDALEL